MIATPISTCTVNGKPVRFFRNPNEDGRPDFAWVAIDDLAVACDTTAATRESYLRDMRAVVCPDACSVAVGGRVMLVVPSYVGQAFVCAMAEVRELPAVEKEYHKAAMAALDVITETVPAGEMGAYLGAAVRRWR